MLLLCHVLSWKLFEKKTFSLRCKDCFFKDMPDSSHAACFGLHARSRMKANHLNLGLEEDLNLFLGLMCHLEAVIFVPKSLAVETCSSCIYLDMSPHRWFPTPVVTTLIFVLTAVKPQSICLNNIN
ncbi:hypothetical protein GOODEAATRI_020600 [Goodea atripinnis]|uniref:Uncharacterized protein n=1 Tax=Goodea atripinnis TaxID=208336 RepID=A0ABV0PFT4_9TELE